MRLWSGVVRDDDGVILVRGNMRGDGAVLRVAVVGVSGCGVCGVKGNPGGVGIIDILFNLRASVGLIVLAASPVA